MGSTPHKEKKSHSVPVLPAFNQQAVKQEREPLTRRENNANVQAHAQEIIEQLKAKSKPVDVKFKKVREAIRRDKENDYEVEEVEDLTLKPAIVGATEPLKPRKSTQLGAEGKAGGLLMARGETEGVMEKRGRKCKVSRML